MGQHKPHASPPEAIMPFKSDSYGLGTIAWHSRSEHKICRSAMRWPVLRWWRHMLWEITRRPCLHLLSSGKQLCQIFQYQLLIKHR